VAFDVATLRVVMRAGEPWFVAADVCRILDLQNPTMAMEKLDADEKGLSSIDTPGGVQNVLVVSEGGYYTLVMRSRDATVPGSVAHRFRRWVTSNVLPSIRKNGGYIAGQEKVATGEMTPAELMARALLAANATIADAQEARRLAEERAVTAQHQADQLQEQVAPNRLVGTGTALASGAGQGNRGPAQLITAAEAPRQLYVTRLAGGNGGTLPAAGGKRFKPSPPAPSAPADRKSHRPKGQASRGRCPGMAPIRRRVAHRPPIQ